MCQIGSRCVPAHTSDLWGAPIILSHNRSKCRAALQLPIRAAASCLAQWPSEHMLGWCWSGRITTQLQEDCYCSPTSSEISHCDGHTLGRGVDSPQPVSPEPLWLGEHQVDGTGVGESPPIPEADCECTPSLSTESSMAERVLLSWIPPFGRDAMDHRCKSGGTDGIGVGESLPTPQRIATASRPHPRPPPRPPPPPAWSNGPELVKA